MGEDRECRGRGESEGGRQVKQPPKEIKLSERGLQLVNGIAAHIADVENANRTLEAQNKKLELEAAARRPGAVE
jgi:hypothetical protein